MIDEARGVLCVYMCVLWWLNVGEMFKNENGPDEGAIFQLCYRLLFCNFCLGNELDCLLGGWTNWL